MSNLVSFYPPSLFFLVLLLGIMGMLLCIILIGYVLRKYKIQCCRQEVHISRYTAGSVHYASLDEPPSYEEMLKTDDKVVYTLPSYENVVAMNAEGNYSIPSTVMCASLPAYPDHPKEVHRHPMLPFGDNKGSPH